MRTIGFVALWLGVFAPLSNAMAQSQSSVVVNGRTISVIGGVNQNVSTTNDSATIVVDNLQI